MQDPPRLLHPPSPGTATTSTSCTSPTRPSPAPSRYSGPTAHPRPRDRHPRGGDAPDRLPPQQLQHQRRRPLAGRLPRHLAHARIQPRRPPHRRGGRRRQQPYIYRKNANTGRRVHLAADATTSAWTTTATSPSSGAAAAAPAALRASRLTRDDGGSEEETWLSSPRYASCPRPARAGRHRPRAHHRHRRVPEHPHRGASQLLSVGLEHHSAPNDTEMRNIAAHMSAPTRAATATPTVDHRELYAVDGGSIDWAYGELGIAAFFTELSGYDFLLLLLHR